MASNSSLGAALGGEGTADKLPGRSLPSLRHGAAYDQPNYEGVTPLAAARALLRRSKTAPSGIDGLRNLYRDLDALGNAPALNALWDEYLWQLLRAWISVRGPQVGASARHAVALTPELSRQVVAFLVGDPSIHA